MTDTNGSVKSRDMAPASAPGAETNAPLQAGPQTGVAPADGAKNPGPPPWLAAHRWKPGQSGNPSGRPREAGSLSAALRRVGIKPASTRAELTKIANQLGLDPEEACNIDVVAGLVYDGIIQLLIRTIKGQTGAGDKLVGLLQILLKALDGDERRITIAGPGELQSALASVSAVLGFRASLNMHSPLGAPQPPIALPVADDAVDAVADEVLKVGDSGGGDD